MKFILLLASFSLVASNFRPRRQLPVELPLDSSSSDSDSDDRRPEDVNVEVINPVVVVEQNPAANPLIRQGRSAALNATQKIRSPRQALVPVTPNDASSDSDSDERRNVDVVDPVVIVEQNPALAPRQKRAASPSHHNDATVAVSHPHDVDPALKQKRAASFNATQPTH